MRLIIRLGFHAIPEFRILIPKRCLKKSRKTPADFAENVIPRIIGVNRHGFAFILSQNVPFIGQLPDCAGEQRRRAGLRFRRWRRVKQIALNQH